MLTPWLREQIGNGLRIEFPTRKKEGRFYLTIFPVKGGEPVQLSSTQAAELQKEVNRLTAGEMTHVLVASSGTYLSHHHRAIPSSWIADILPYISIDLSLKPKVSRHGLEVDLRHIIDYQEVYLHLATNIAKQIRDMYRQGYIVRPSPGIVSSWSLLSVDTDQRLYLPSWSDRRIVKCYHGMVGFLQSRISGVETVDFHIGENWVHRHQVAQVLDKIELNQSGGFGTESVRGLATTFIGPIVRVKIEDITQARTVASMIYGAVATAEGKALNIMVARRSWVDIYFSVVSEMDMNRCIGYRTSDPTRSYTFSCMADFGDSLDLKMEEIERRTLLKISELKIQLDQLQAGEKEKMDFHDAIERGLLPIPRST